MSNTETRINREIASGETPAEPPLTRVVFSMGGKGGVGKTALVASLASWYNRNGIPVQLLDLDSENKARGSLSHFFPSAEKVNINTPAGLDTLVDRITDGVPIVLADMGAGAGSVTTRWFDEMCEAVAEAGIAFTAIGVVTDDPASVESLLTWATNLQNRVSYLVVKNSVSPHSAFNYFENSQEAKRFTDVFRPAVIRMGYRLPEIENVTRNHGVTLARVASRSTDVPELQKSSRVMRAQGYLRELFKEFDTVKEVLLP